MATKTIDVTKDWQQVADSDCVVQSLFYAGEFCLAVGGMPTDDHAYVLMNFDKPCTLEFGKAVFLKLPHSYTGKGEKLTVIE